jgi:8-oxo-dGTP pyrophosphatase MutT (NUDIX family)
VTVAPGWLRELVSATSELSAGELSQQVPPPPESARRSAVLVLFGESDGRHDLLLIERAHDLRSHAGQLAFPGGSADDGETAVQTALRESQEEIGVDPAGVEVLGELPALWLPPTNFAVTCVLAWWRDESAVGVVDPLEVAAVLRVPLTDLVDPDRRVTVVHPLGYRGPGFVVSDLVLWGFTAAVVDRVLLHAGLAEPWDRSRTVPAPVSPGEEAR